MQPQPLGWLAQGEVLFMGGMRFGDGGGALLGGQPPDDVEQVEF